MTVDTKANLLTRANSIRTAIAGNSISPSSVGSLIRDLVDSTPGVVFGVSLTVAVPSAAAANLSAINGAITAANTLGGGIVDISGNVGSSYLATGILLKSGVVLRGGPGVRLLLADGQNGPVVSTPAGASFAALVDIEIDGNKANNSGGHGFSAAAGGSYITVRDSRIHDCSGDGARFTSCANVLVSGSQFLDNAAQGLTADTLSYFSWTGNLAEGNGFHGFGGVGILAYGTITGNEAHNNGTTAPFADNITLYNSGCHHVTITGNNVSGGGNNGIHVGGSYLTVTGNTVTAPLQHGIVIVNHDGSVSAGNSITGNTVNACPQSGFWCDKVEDSAFSGNVSIGNAGHGFYFDTSCVNITGAGNQAKGNAGAGLRVNGCTAIDVQGEYRGNFRGAHFSSSTRCRVSSKFYGNTNDGFYLLASTDNLITGCDCKANLRPFTEDTGSSGNKYLANDFVGNTGDTPVLVTTASVGTIWKGNDCGGTATLASASALTLPIYVDYIVISGAVTITSIAAVGNWRERTIKLRFDASCQLNSDNNIHLAGDANFSATANDTVTLVCDGADWWECGRSVN